MEVSEEIKKAVKEHRLKQLEQQIADVQLTMTIYQKMIETYEGKEDRAQLAVEIMKLDRLQLAYETVKGV